MATHERQSDEPGFVPFFRSYTRTWIHAVATAGLTAFGTLTIVHRWFAALAIASYVVPPVVLYVRKLRAHERAASGASEHGIATETEADSGSEIESEVDSRNGAGSRSETEPESDPRTAVASETGSGAELETGAEAESEAELDADVEPEPVSESAPEPELEATRSRDDEPTAGSALEDARPDRAPASSREDERRDDDLERSDDSGDGQSDEEDERREDGDEQAGADEEGADRADWELLEDAVPNATTLFDVVVTESGAAYATGADGLVVAETGQGWTTVLEDGPAAQRNDLRGVDATADGDAIWVAGDGGAVGRIDAESGRHVDYTAPADRTDNLAGVAVGGSAGDETILLINGSGEVLRGRYADGAPSWDDPVEPGGGSSLADVALADESVGYCCDTNDGVFETDDGGRSFDRIGLEGADGTLEAVATTGRSDCLVSADDGVVHRYEDAAATWTPERVAAAALLGIARRGERTVACAADGTIHERSAASKGSDWEPFDTDAAGPLHAVSIGADRAVAVGAKGNLLERA